MSDIIQQKNPVIYLAPLQGFTDFVYRKAYAEIFTGVDTCFIPYISVKNNEVLKKYLKEIQSEKNPHQRVIPQVLAGDASEMLFLTGILKNHGYTEINLNLGCPYPMVTNRGKGAGLLPHPEKISMILTAFFENTDLHLSVKLRAGLNSSSEIEKVIPVLNSFPLTEVIFHPRIAKQLYDGEILDSAFQYAKHNLKHRLVYNGNIFSVDDFKECQQKFPETEYWMLGRGILMNPFLPAEIKKIEISNNEKREKLKEFHQSVLKYYSDAMDNEGNVLNKMKQFWIYFSYSFNNQKRNLKLIGKTKSLAGYKAFINEIFSESKN